MAKITKGDVYNFVKENLVTANDRKMACGDGRYEKEQSKGAIRAFGADFGMVMAFAATLKDNGVNLPPQELVEKYVNAKQKLLGVDVVLDYHCDSHNHQEGNIGCGHIAKAASPENDGKYGSINSEDVSALFEAFRQSPASRLTVLNGEHKEEGVLFVHIAEKTINSKNKKGKMFFVIDTERTDSYIERVTSYFSEGLPVPINAADVIQNYQLQMSETARILKADQLPHYKVAVDQSGHLTMEELRKPKSN